MNVSNSVFYRNLCALSAVQIEFLRTSVVQRRLACSVGDISPTGVRVRSPVAWIAFVEETKWLAVANIAPQTANIPVVDRKSVV